MIARGSQRVCFLCVHACVLYAQALTHSLVFIPLQARSGRYASIVNEEEMELYHKRSGDILQSSSLCGKVRDHLDHVAINISRTFQLHGEVGMHTAW